MTNPTRRVVLLSLLMSAEMPFAQTADENQGPVEAPVLHLSDQWEYKLIDGFTNVSIGTEQIEVLDASPSGYRMLFRRSNKEKDVTLELNEVQHVDGLPPDTGLLHFPLTKGSTWSSRTFYETHENANGVWDLTHEVIGRSRLQVAAGEFEVFEIRGKGYWNLRKPPLRRTSDWSGHFERTVWYAPAVKRWARMETRSFASGHVGDWVRADLASYKVQ